MNETIIAQSSAIGCGRRGILRLSGSQSVDAVKKIVREPASLILETQSAIVSAQIQLPDFPPFPAKLFLWQNGHSYTGEETVEIHTAGSQVLLNKIIGTVIAMNDGVRLANAGEFTLRAFLSGRLDLTQAEAVLGVIEAASETDLKTALSQLAGNVAAPLTELRQQLFDGLAHIEAGLDFADEDITFIEPETLREMILNAIERLSGLRKQIELRSSVNEKPKVVLAGKPNAGKSTLFNKLLGNRSAIVSPQAGTTRDYLEAETMFGGFDAILVDTAGVDTAEIAPTEMKTLISDVATSVGAMIHSDSEIDQDAQQKASDLQTHADIVIYCFESDADKDNTFAAKPNVLFYKTKRPDESLDKLRRDIAEMLSRSGGVGEVLPNTAIRCRESVTLAEESLRRALTLTDGLPDESLIALELRNAMNHLGLIDGSVHTEDLLDRIFSRFCIGK